MYDYKVDALTTCELMPDELTGAAPGTVLGLAL
jgi:hypothetical protein